MLNTTKQHSSEEVGELRPAAPDELGNPGSLLDSCFKIEKTVHHLSVSDICQSTLRIYSHAFSVVLMIRYKQEERSVI